MTKKIFIHGLESSNRGAKARYFSEHFPDMVIPNFSGSLAERMAKLMQLTAAMDDLILVGSSYGGLMATLFAIEHEARVKKLILLAPALNFDAFRPYHGRKISIPVWLYQGRNDVVTPWKDVAVIAEKIFLSLQLHPVEDDHLLRKIFEFIDWPSLLS